MGAQQVLRTAACAVLIASPAVAGSAWKGTSPKLHERVAVIDIDATLMARYPEMDAALGRELFELDIQPEVADAAVYIDFAPESSTHVVIAAGEHSIAAGKGARRGYVAGPAV